MVAIGPQDLTIKTCDGCPSLKITRSEKKVTNYFGETEKVNVANIQCGLGKSKPQIFRGIIFLPPSGCPAIKMMESEEIINKVKEISMGHPKEVD